MALMVLAALVGIGLACVGLVVQSLRQNRDDAEPLVIRERAPLEKSEGDRAGTPSRDASGTQESVDGYHFHLFI